MYSVAVATSLLALSSQKVAAQPTFPADAATATDNSGQGGVDPGAPNLAAASLGGLALERQELIPVTSLPRTCACLPQTTVVLSLPLCTTGCGFGLNHTWYR